MASAFLSSLQRGQVSVPCGCQIVVPFPSADSESCVQLRRLPAAFFPHGQSLRSPEHESYIAACSKEATGIPSQVYGMQRDPRMTILSSNRCSSYPISGILEGFVSLSVALGFALHPILSCPLQEFPGTPVTNYHKSGSLQPQECIPAQLSSPELQDQGVTWVGFFWRLQGRTYQSPASLFSCGAPSNPQCSLASPPCAHQFLLPVSPPIFSSCKDTSRWIEGTP